MSTAEAEEPEWRSFLAALEAAVGVLLSQYKEPQIKRRLANLMERRGLLSWSAFKAAIGNDAALLAEVRDSLTINVSEFFRQPERFEELWRTHLPGLLAERRTLKLWSAGCSIGCEPYSLAMILAELEPENAHTVLATDIDIPILTRARAGRGYSSAEVRSLPPCLLERYMTCEGATYRVNDSIKSRVTFRRHDLLSDAYPGGLDLILCRNVVIYFAAEAKEHVFERFANALRPGGLLFLGGSELIMRPDEAGFRSSGGSMYQRAA